MPETKLRDQLVQLAVTIGLVANIVLAGLKVSVGIIGRSPALLADGINSTVDVAYYVVVAVFMNIARKPPDEDHPYGHRQFESIAGVAVGAFVITTGITILWNAINTIYEVVTGIGDFSGATQTALIVAVGTVLVKVVLMAITQNLGRRADSATVMALAYDHRNDIFSALAATVGIVLGRMGYFWVDPLAGAIVALVILRTGISIIQEASGDLLTPAPGSKLSEKITMVLNVVPGVIEVEELYIHRFGPYMTVDVTIVVDGDITVTEGNYIATVVDRSLRHNMPFVRRVHVHYHPAKHLRKSAHQAEPIIVDMK